MEKPGSAKIAYSVSDKVAGITKGRGTDVGDIGATVLLRYANAPDNSPGIGSFTLPPGAFDGTAGWVTNDEKGAKYVNKAAPAGVTVTKSATVKPGRQLKLSAKGPGDAPFDVVSAGDRRAACSQRSA